MSFIDFLFGIIVGIGTNLLSWWILFHLIVPKTSFSPDISKVSINQSKGDMSGYKYRIKIENSGRRAIIDVRITARLRIRGIGSFPQTNWHIVNIPLSSDGDSYEIPRLLPIRKGMTRRHTLRLLINNANDFQTNSIYPESIRKKAKNSELLLDDLLKLGNKANLQVLAFGYDEFSGTRKLFVSKSYSLADIKEGPFDSMSLNIRDLSDHNKKDEDTDTEDDVNDQ